MVYMEKGCKWSLNSRRDVFTSAIGQLLQLVGRQLIKIVASALSKGLNLTRISSIK